jgi:hypothetical protein
MFHNIVCFVNRNLLWLLGVYVPVGQKIFFKMSKNYEKKISVHLNILCSLTKFCKKKIIFMTCVKKTTFLCYKIAIYVAIFCLFIQGTKNVFSHQNCGGWT